MNFKSENNLPDKKVLSKTVISLITAIVILVAGIGLLTNYYFASQVVIEQFKSVNIKLKNRNAELMNENAELMNKNTEITKKLLEIRSELETTKIDLVVAKAKLETATFELREEMLTLPKQSPKFDCDDSALYMYLYFTNLGYDVRIIAGNLDLENETFWQCKTILGYG